jgi:predicted phosphate transport protein (TIGR00153 family)
MVPRPAPAAQPTVPQLLDAFGSEVERCARLTRELLAGFPEQPELARDIKDCEHEGDRIARELIHALGRGAGANLPFDAREGLRLATAVDDIVDHLEQAADMLGLYAVEATMEQAIALADVLVCAAGEVAGALRKLGAAGDPAAHLAEVHRLEDEADRLSRGAVASLFIDRIDPMVVIRWKDIFDTLESAADACEHVAHLIEGIELRRGQPGL